MDLLFIFALLATLTLLGYRQGSQRAVALAAGRPRSLHSRPVYHGAFVVLATLLPAIGLLVLWMIVAPILIRAAISGQLPPDVRALPGEQLSFVLTNIRNLALNRIVGGEITPAMREAAAVYARLKSISDVAMVVAVVGVAAAGFMIARGRVHAALRARPLVERAVKVALAASSTVAILTTVGIVLSMAFESLRFFAAVSPLDFFVGTVWDPRFTAAGRDDTAGQFGLVPLLWGTLFISTIAMAVAVPVGLMSAIYLAEYAHPRLRAFAKPMLEILAGIPTVVYGFFALVTVGPWLRDFGDALGLTISATSALCAGAVMGIMIIPFVSSLSDDIITAVPRGLRDGSYGLGATRSETIKQVVMPAALPGIVGSVLLAVSRALGETMIVVMAAGIAANLTLNPFEPVTTITVKIVSQLTGDLEFTSPQTLVAFALGITLFVLTLGLNVIALQIVRKYREQYE
jgi:phosphate transport system permease protein